MIRYNEFLLLIIACINERKSRPKSERVAVPAESDQGHAASGKTFYIVSGLPRSGTSLMMQMLEAGGLAPMTDGERRADEDNPEGYYEWEPIKTLHQRPRVIVGRALSPRSIGDIEPRAKAIADELVRNLEDRSEFDLIADFAQTFPIRVICEVMGVPARDGARVHKCAGSLIKIVEPLHSVEELSFLDASAREAHDYFIRLIAARREEPRDDALSAMVARARETGHSDSDLGRVKK